MFTFLLIVQTLIAASLVTVILMQRSEGGGLGVGGSSSGLMSARGAADFLTRATAVLGTLFVVLSIVLAGLAAVQRAPVGIDPALARTRGPAAPAAPLGGVPLAGDVPAAAVDPLAGAAEQAAAAPPPPAASAERERAAQNSPAPAAEAPAAETSTNTPAPAAEPEINQETGEEVVPPTN
jgi:preprotein translocase subunit SecG